MANRIAVTGIGCLSAAGNTLEQAMASMLGGERHGGDPLRFTTTHADVYPVFSIADDFEQVSQRDMLRTSRLGLAAAGQAVTQSGWSLEALRGLRVGVCMGTTVGSAMNNEPFYAGYRDGASPEMTPINRFLGSNPAAVISRHFGFNGPTQTIVNACSSGTDAIGLASAWIQCGLCDVVLAGGADELCRTTYNGFASLQISSTRLCRPFDAERSGLNLGEGAGVLVLESDASARHRQVPAQGYILGYGSGTDGWHLTAPHPEGRGLKQALAEALRVSRVQPKQLGFVNTHGTGTKDNDRVESLVLRDCLKGLPFHSTKGYTGHTLGAAGAIEAAFVLGFLQRRKIPASAGFTTMDDELATVPVTQVHEFDSSLALSESLAFGGNNAVLVFERGEVV
ncbi:beta-ketoacyl-[acyl-carrier-protein] synthase family protein [Desulfuromonas acetoxidans]|uniref:Beta-ketoacyl synthase n=1 Tax=Desulfuromonas acetoxidans (strain DSM 684 / 11070) TaxID=281689 RepID=Q1K0R6_DESA6|nr:beta-ketoacyl-[acyl-carrier-protein] synthase family protein [Desulfuromonas acetoxidans]EAT15875.1 beta-ketoacyl synthase [Desulfuromonas acetoxidans DSM 684]MBF0646871.1 beta-ketoacyl-[acyl-carrier-protein] synthase family protein [Desulfuromonas acetoxidans]NVD24475.1 beta-ketoacyl-[acyl-carrier-protein] synthase family protein [Desulfuromonas acetoxidans]NVE16576.1 beta-ketoacyl-[acyl-carrier-protein] synthase family protein [Desulfuromonas acetoxidans]